MSPALRGVNLGGWLVSERWMTPSLYDGVTGQGELELSRQLGALEATRRLTAHRDTFVTESDFAWIADAGYAFVRLPVGYWVWAGEDGFVPAAEHLEQAFVWAERHGLRVVLDLHGLPGSQNGRDHSGQTGAVGLYREGNVTRAVTTVARLASTYGRHPALLGLELVNEPRMGWRAGRLLGFYDAAFAAAAEHLPPPAKIIVSDAYQARRMAWRLGRRRLGEQLVLDVHLYQLFTWWERREGFDRHLRRVDRDWRRLLTRLARRIPLLIGEWTAELPPAALADDRDARIRRYFEVQSELFDSVAWAHSYWSYRTAGDTGAWSLRDTGLIGEGH